MTLLLKNGVKKTITNVGQGIIVTTKNLRCIGNRITSMEDLAQGGFVKQTQDRKAADPIGFENGVEMPIYQSHKKVWALKIKEIVVDGGGTDNESDGSAMITPEESAYSPFKVDSSYMHKHNPEVGGYYVVYEDGYKSWSPAGAFEGGTTPL